MKKGLFVFLIIFYSQLSAQISITGKVTTTTNIALEGASVYLNNTTIGVSTKSDGQFELTTKPGIYELIISYIGYKTIRFNLNTSQYKKPFDFQLAEEENILNEVVLKKTIYNEDWKFNLKQFKTNFIGKTNLSKQCELLNPKILHFEFDKTSNTLTAEAREPLKLKHKGLGYLITVDLELFQLGQNKVHYLGYTRFENLKGSKRKQKKWKKNRRKAYNGSKMHFVRSLINNTAKEEGFLINFFRRELNSKRPKDHQIKHARNIIKLTGIGLVNFQKKITKPITQIDSAIVVLRKASLPKYADYLYKSDAHQKEITTKINNKHVLSFKNYISVIYQNEPEETNYVMGPFGKKRQTLNVQTSSMVMLTKSAILEKTGEIINPLDVFYEGYWAYEQFADTLPLNYQPIDD